MSEDISVALLCALLLESKHRESDLLKWAAGWLVLDDEGFSSARVQSQRLTPPPPQLYLEIRYLSL